MARPQPVDPWAFAANLFDPPEITSRWYCDRTECDGEPHTGWHWCDHPNPHPTGDEYWTCRHARTNQRPPSGEWRIWLLLAGRGFGKTRTGAEWTAHNAKSYPASNWACVAPTGDDLRQTVFEGDSGLLRALDMRRGDDAYNKTNMTIRLSNGSLIRGLSAERPERTRGPNLMGAWLDEFAIWRYQETYDDLLPALRRGDARTIITTTPRPTPRIKEFAHREDGSVQITRGTMWDNVANLSKVQLDDLRLRWEGTRQGRQELYGDLLEDDPGALWSRMMIETARCEMDELPDVSDLLRVA